MANAVEQELKADKKCATQGMVGRQARQAPRAHRMNGQKRKRDAKANEDATNSATTNANRRRSEQKLHRGSRSRTPCLSLSLFFSLSVSRFARTSTPQQPIPTLTNTHAHQLRMGSAVRNELLMKLLRSSLAAVRLSVRLLLLLRLSSVTPLLDHSHIRWGVGRRG